MAEAMPSSAPAPAAEGESTAQPQQNPWHISFAEDLQRTVSESADSAIRSAQAIQQNSSSRLRSLQEFIAHVESQYRTFEDAFFKKVKDELMSAKEHPAVAGAVAVTAGLIFLRGPRRFLFRHTLGRFQSEEAQFVRAEDNVKELNLSVDLLKMESNKLLDRTALAEKEMKHGHAELMNIGSQIQRLSRTAFKVEAQAADLMDGLRETPGREALKLRSEVASMASLLKHERIALDKRIMKISELGVPV